MSTSILTDDMKCDERFIAIAYMVGGRLHAYQEQDYTAAFVNDLDYQRLGEAIQRAFMMQQLHEIAVAFNGKIPDAELLFPGMSIPKLEITK